MGKLYEAIGTFALAIRYSLAFCWRYSKKETLARITLTSVATICSYVVIWSTGKVFNSLQVTNSHKSAVTSVDYETTLPLIILAATMVVLARVNLKNQYYRGVWSQKLRQANELELNRHKSSLDITRVRSKEFDNLCKQIRELPMGWNTRSGLCEEIISLVATLVSTVTFGISLLWYKPIYALFITLTSLPILYLEFRMVANWWRLYEEMVPHNKHRSMLEKPFCGHTSFLQAMSFNQLPILNEQIEGNLQTVFGRYEGVRKKWLSLQGMSDFCSTAGLLAIILHSIYEAKHGRMPVGTLTVVIAAARTFQGNFEAFVNLIANQWNNAKGVILIEKDYLGLKPLLQTVGELRPEFAGPPEIELDHVSFTYPETGKEILHDISLVIRPGEKIAVVGKNGHGKSTLMHLLCRHYDPTKGCIRVGGVHLRRIPPDHWNEYVTIFMQEYAIMERRVGEEIASSRLDEPLDMEKIQRSAEFALFSEVINSDPLGFQTQIGTEFGGREFSGGEGKRLALARAAYRCAPILILDEPDERLDPHSAKAIMDNVFALTNMTIIVITHHVSRAMSCDRVIVMKDGKIDEQGDPKELLQKGGTFSQLFAQDRKRIDGN